MTTFIVDSGEPITLIGGGALRREELELALSFAPRVIAADGGAQAALDFGVMPEAVIGDLDSLSPEARAVLAPESIFSISEQDSTDFDKALRSIRAPYVIAVGFLGERLDHQLAALNVLVKRPSPPCFLLGANELVLHLQTDLALDMQPGETVSLFPMAAVTGRSKGLEWPIDELQLEPNGMVGTSNRALGPIEISMDQPGLLAILPPRVLPQLTQAIERAR